MSNVPAILSVVAAFLSVMTAWLVYRTHRSNLQESVRPVMVILDWQSATDDTSLEPGAEVCLPVVAKRIANIGRGPAMAVQIAWGLSRSKLQTEVGFVGVAAGASEPVDITLYLPKGDKSDSHVWLRLECQDCRGGRHFVLFQVRAVPVTKGVTESTCPHRGEISYRRWSASKRVFAMNERLRKWPVIRGFMREENYWPRSLG